MTVATLGVDLAAEPVGTAVVRLDWDDAQPRATVLPRRMSDAQLVEAIAGIGIAKVGIDCPFGWPAGFVDAVSAHAAGRTWPGGEGPAARRILRLRLTDREVAARFKEPLSVSSTYIGATAMRCASILNAWRSRDPKHDRVGTGRLIEVYPALAMRHWHLDMPGYKNGDNWAKARKDILNAVGHTVDVEEVREAVLQSKTYGDDVIDALVAALVAASAMTPGGVEPPPASDTDERRIAEIEGWIAVPSLPLHEVDPRPASP
ncbi:hypothetical protein Acsp07_09580 [Actinomycetospora sp. NBRC 106378]|nr:hypothetical protein Acsp07_09580 [Actinomycetospora sp. NBRC 106378]